MDLRSGLPTCGHQRDGAVVADYLARRLEPVAEEGFERHVFACADCWEELRLAVEIRAATRRGATASGPWRAALAAAAVLAVALVGAGIWWRAAQAPPTAATPVLRGSGDGGLAVGLRRDSDRRQLWWDAVAGAATYRVETFDSAGRSIGAVETSAAHATIDLADPANSAASSARVSALDALRQTILASPPIALR